MEDIEIDDELSQQPAKRRELTGRDMLINVVEGEEIRIAVIRRSQLEELYMERSSTESHIGNIYKGRVTNVEPSIQAAFIDDFGIGARTSVSRSISGRAPPVFPQENAANACRNRTRTAATARSSRRVRTSTARRRARRDSSPRPPRPHRAKRRMK